MSLNQSENKRKIIVFTSFFLVVLFLFFYFQNPHNLDSDYLFFKAAKEEAKGNLDVALSFYQIISRRENTYKKTISLIKASQVYQQQNQFSKSTELLKEAISLTLKNENNPEQIARLEIEISNNIVKTNGIQQAIEYLLVKNDLYSGEHYITSALDLKITKLKEDLNDPEFAERLHQKVLKQIAEKRPLSEIDYIAEKEKLLTLSEEYLKNKQFVEFEDYFLKVIEKFIKNNKYPRETLGIIKQLIRAYNQEVDNLVSIEGLLTKLNSLYAEDSLGNYELLSELGNLYLLYNENKKALELFDKLALKNIPSALMASGKIYKEKQEYRKAEEYFLKAIKVLSKKEKLFFNDESFANCCSELAELYAEQKKIKEAVNILKKAVKTVKKESRHYPLLQLGELYHKIGDIPNTLKIFYTILKEDKKNEKVYLSLINLEMERGNYAAAEELCLTYQNILPEPSLLSELLKERLKIYQQKRDFEKAISLIQLSLKQYSQNQEEFLFWYISLGNIYLKMQREKEAEDIFKEIISQYKDHPKSNEAYVELIKLAKKEKDDAKVEDLYNKVITGTKDRLTLSWWLQEKSHWYLAKGELDKARSLVENSLESFKNDSRMLFTLLFDLGGIYLKEGQEKIAEDIFKDLIKNYPGHVLISEVYIVLGNLERNRLNFEQAEIFYKDAIETFHDKTQLSWAMREEIKLYEKTKEERKIIQLIEENIHHLQVEAELAIPFYLILGKSYSCIGEIKKAKEIFTYTLERYKNYPELDSVREKLEEISRLEGKNR